ncbi:MAG: mechanosensitive ion channel domain-containing protein, partial [Gammaproteobacteria bacterium]
MKAIVFFFIHSGRLTALPLLLLLFAGSADVWSKSTESGQRVKDKSTTAMTKKVLQTRIESLRTRQGLDEVQKNKLLSAYQAAEDNVKAIEKFNAQAAEYKKAIMEAPARTQKILREIELRQPKLEKQKLEDFSRIPTEELEQRLVLEKGKISILEDQAKKKEAELILQVGRPQSIREEMVAAKRMIDETQKQLETVDSGSASKLDLEAKQIQLKTQIDASSAELGMLDAEAGSNPSRVALLKAELQRLEAQKNELTPLIAAIEVQLSERRQQEAKEIQDALSQAERELSGKHPLIQDITRENIQYSRDLQAVAVKIEKYDEQKIKIDEKTAEIEKDFKSADKKISLAGVSPALGRILREQRRNLLDQDRFALHSEIIQNETALTSLEQLGIEEKMKGFIDTDSQLKKLMQLNVDNALPLGQRMMIQAELRVLINSQRDLLNKLSAAYTTYLRTLGDVDFARQQLLSLARKYAEFLDERLLWVPSSEPVNTNYPKGLYRSIQWLLSPVNWKSVVLDARRIGTDNFFLTVFALLGVLLLRIFRKRAKQQLLAISEKVEKIYTDNFSCTLK